MNKDAIISLVKSAGWQEVEQMLISEVVETAKPINIKTTGKSNEEIAREIEGLQAAAKIVKNVLNKIRRMGEEKNTIKQSSFK